MKKRSKKLLQMTSGRSLAAVAAVLAEMDKSFLLLFFKKEESFLASRCAWKKLPGLHPKRVLGS